MPASEKDRTSHVTFDGRTIVNTNALLRDPKVQETLLKLSRVVKRSGAGVKIIKRVS